jgi:hypothetical protein
MTVIASFTHASSHHVDIRVLRLGRKTNYNAVESRTKFQKKVANLVANKLSTELGRRSEWLPILAQGNHAQPRFYGHHLNSCFGDIDDARFALTG